MKAASASLPKRFRTCDQVCYRQEAHEKDRVWQLLAQEALPETIAAWTTSLSLAKAFKGGVAPLGLQGVIFAITPSSDQVILNLSEVYAAPEFQEAREAHRAEIPAFSSGIGKYGDTQSEIVLDVARLGTADVLSYGGYSSTIEDLAALALGHPPSADELELFTTMAASAAIQAGAWWLSRQGTSRVLARMEPRLAILRDGA